MKKIILIIVLSSVVTVLTLPILILQPPGLRLQEQLQSLQRAPFGEKIQWPQPLIIVSPPNNIFMPFEKMEFNSRDAEEVHKTQDGDEDSLVIEAQSDSTAAEFDSHIKMSTKNERFIVGQIISGIPWLPFEVNVPDTITWIWNGITGVISGIGQRLPQRQKPAEGTEQESSVKWFQNSVPPKYPVLSGHMLMIPGIPGPTWQIMPNVPYLYKK